MRLRKPSEEWLRKGLKRKVVEQQGESGLLYSLKAAAGPCMYLP
jgi:hypothetical protein